MKYRQDDHCQKWMHESVPCSTQEDGVNCGVFVIMVGVYAIKQNVLADN